MKTSTRLNLYASLAAAVAAPAIMLHKLLPDAGFVMSLWYVCCSIGAWMAFALLIYVVNWVFFGTLVLFGQWIWDSFYRTPTR